MSRGGKEFGKEIFLFAAFRLRSFARTKYPALFCGKGFGRISLEKMLLFCYDAIFRLRHIQHISEESTVLVRYIGKENIFSFWLLLLAALGGANLHKFIQAKNEGGSSGGNSLFYGICKVHLKCHLRTFLWAGMQLIIVGRQQRLSSSPCNLEGKMCAFMDKLRHFERRPTRKPLPSEYQLNTIPSRPFVGTSSLFIFSCPGRAHTFKYFLRESGTIYPLETTEVSGN